MTQELRHDVPKGRGVPPPNHVTLVDPVRPRTLSPNLENGRFDPHDLKDYFSLSFLSSEALILTMWNTLTMPN